MREYSIRINQRPGEGYASMIITDRVSRQAVAEYRLTNGRERAEVQAMRRTIDKHLRMGGTVRNYQW